MVTIGGAGHAQNEREENDYYATSPEAISMLLKLEIFDNVYECACGGGHLAKVLEEKGLLGKATDLIYRGYGEGGVDFLKVEKWDGCIITNPPYKMAQQFIEHAIEIIPEGKKVAMFLRIQFLEGKNRRKMFDKYPPKTIYVSSKRIACALGGDFNTINGSATCYAWYVWEKGYKGDTTMKWFN